MKIRFFYILLILSSCVLSAHGNTACLQQLENVCEREKRKKEIEITLEDRTLN